MYMEESACFGPFYNTSTQTLSHTISPPPRFFFSLSFFRFDWYAGFHGHCHQFLDGTGHVELTRHLCTERDHTHHIDIDLCLYIVLTMFLAHGQYD